MREYKESISLNGRATNPIDSALEQNRIAGSNITTDEGCNIDPARTADLLLKSRALRVEQFQKDKLYIDDVSWHILLDLMVSKDAKKPITVLDLAITLNVTKSITLKYVLYLSGAGLIDKYIDTEGQDRVPLELTASGAALTGDALRKIGKELRGFSARFC